MDFGSPRLPGEIGVHVDAGPSSPRPKRRRLRIAACFFALVVAACVITGALLYRQRSAPERIRLLAERELGRFFQTDVRVESAHYSWSEGVSLFGVTVAEPDSQGAGVDRPARHRPAAVLSCPEIRVQLNVWLTLFGRPAIQNVVLLGPTFAIARDAQTGASNLCGLIQDIEMRPTGTRASPTIEIRNGRIRVMQREANQDRVVEDLTLTMRSRPSFHEPYLLDVSWETAAGPASRGRASLNLRSSSLKNVEGGLPWMDLEAVMVGVHAGYPSVGTWSEILGLEGKVRALDYDFGGTMELASSRLAVVQLHGASLSIPIDRAERQLPPDQRYLRFTDVDGTVRLRADRIEARFDGQFHSGRVRAEADFVGVNENLHSLEDVDVDVSVRVEGIALPRVDPDAPIQERRFVERWPKLKEMYRVYDPHGKADVELEVSKGAGGSAALDVKRCLVTARGGDASHEDYPYRVADLEGSVDYAPDGLWIRNLCGNHGKGRVCVDGWAGGTDRCVPVELQILGTELQIDDSLADAVPAVFRRIRDDFSPVGTIDVLIAAKRIPCEDFQRAQWRTEFGVDLRNLSVHHRRLACPIENVTGIVAVDGNTLELKDLAGTMGPSAVHASGEVQFLADRPDKLDVELRILDAELDDCCLSGIHASVDEFVRTWQVDGLADVRSTIQRDSNEGPFRYTTWVQPFGASLVPLPLPVPIRDVHGTLRLTDDAVEIPALTGRFGDSVLCADGFVSFHPNDATGHLRLHGTQVFLDESLRKAFPRAIAEVLKELSIEGPLSIDSDIAVDPRVPEVAFLHRTNVFFSGNTVRHGRVPEALTSLRGIVEIQNRHVRTNGLTAWYGPAAARGRFDLDLDSQGMTMDASIDISGLSLGPAARGLLPPRAQAAWAYVEPAGQANVHIGRLHVVRSEGQTRPTVFVSGGIDLVNARFDGIFPAREVRGHIAGEGWVMDSDGRSSLAGTASIDSLEISDRGIGQVFSPWTYAALEDGRGQLAVGPVAGKMYDGAVTAEAEFAFESENTSFRYSLMAHRIDLARFLNASAAKRVSAGTEPIEVRGSLNAYLQVSGRAGDDSSRRGVGRVQILDGHLYRLPLIVAVLNVVNLKIPQKDFFHDAHADFYVAGNRVQIDEFRLQSNEIALVGTGTMSLPDYTVDMKLVNLKPLRWAQVPIVEDLVSGVSRNLVELHVTGPLTRPAVRSQPLGGVTNELKSLFTRKKSRPLQPLEP